MRTIVRGVGRTLSRRASLAMLATIALGASAVAPAASEARWLGRNLIHSASWTHRPAGWTLMVSPTRWARAWAGNGNLSYSVGAAGWKELYRKYRSRGLNTNLGGMRDQFICHQQIGALKKTWNLDEWRRDVSYAQTLLDKCNPSPATNPSGQCSSPCPTTPPPPPPRDCHIDTTHYPPRYYGCPMVTVEQSTYAYSTPYLNARVRHPLKRSAYVALCEALGARTSPYQNPWWSRLRDGYWVNNGYLRGGHTRKMGIGDCAAPPNDVPPLPRLYTQTQIRSGTAPYGKCAGTAGHVSCRGVQLTNLQLPGTFDVPSGQRRVKVNVKASEAFRQVVVAIDRAGLGSRIKQFQTWNERGCRYRTGGWIRGCVSMHSYGVAIDVNPGIPNATEDGQPLAPVRKIFLAHGFVWGHTFAGNDDPPHFQYAKLR